MSTAQTVTQRFVRYIYHPGMFGEREPDIRPADGFNVVTVHVPANAHGFTFVNAETIEKAKEALQKDTISFYFGNKENVLTVEEYSQKNPTFGLLADSWAECGANRVLVLTGYAQLGIRDHDIVIDRETRELAVMPLVLI